MVDKVTDASGPNGLTVRKVVMEFISQTTQRCAANQSRTENTKLRWQMNGWTFIPHTYILMETFESNFSIPETNRIWASEAYHKIKPTSRSSERREEWVAF